MIAWVFSLMMFGVFPEYVLQDRDTVFIEFDNECPNSYLVEKGDRVTFILYPSINQSRFLHDKGSQKEMNTCCMEIKNQLISKAKLNELAIELHLEKQEVFENETGMKGLPPVIPSLNLNVLFDTMYIYRSIDDKCGVIYEVKWIPAL